MKKNNTTKPTTETAAAAAVAAPVAQPTTEPKQEQKPDFYARLLTDRPKEAASIMATLNRRKDYALRQLAAQVKAGRNVSEALHQAMATAFPTHKGAAA